MRLVVQDMTVTEIWVNGRAPIITIHDYDWGETDLDPAFDDEGFAFSPINWRGPAWMLGLSFHPPASSRAEYFSFHSPKKLL
jgi:ParB family chromosome partitioning protein